MTVSNKLYIPVLVLSCLISACGSGSDDSDVTDEGAQSEDIQDADADAQDTDENDVDVQGAASIAMIQGEWAADCLILNADVYTRNTFSIIGEIATAELVYYSDSECSVINEISFPLGIVASSVQFPGVTVPTGATVETTLGAAVALDLYIDEPTINNEALPSLLVGLSGYAAEVAYDIVIVDQDRLFFGNKDLAGYDGTTVETRPISLDFENVFNRVQ